MPTLVANSQGSVTGGTPLTISINIPAGSNQALVVMASCVDNTDKLSGGSATHNGVSMGSPAFTMVTGVDRNFIYCWVLVAPSQGTNNVVITPTSASYVGAVCSAWDDVHQTTPITTATDGYTSAFPSSPLTRTLSVSSGQTAVDLLCIRSTGQTLTPGGTQIGSTFNSASLSTLAGSYTDGAVSSTSWTFTGTNGTYAAIVLQPPGGGGGGLSIPVVMNQYRQRRA